MSLSRHNCIHLLDSKVQEMGCYDPTSHLRTFEAAKLIFLDRYLRTHKGCSNQVGQIVVFPKQQHGKSREKIAVYESPSNVLALPCQRIVGHLMDRLLMSGLDCFVVLLVLS